ncbi:MAG: Efflux transporter, family, subunit, partial [Deltaproteobacteria bacterium]|nr:Efflux transporter, family, subunit [Deltaproteobacteria bacterium]
MKMKSLMIIGGAVILAVVIIYLSRTGFLGNAAKVSQPPAAQAPAQSAEQQPQGSMPAEKPEAKPPAPAEAKKPEDAPTVEIPSEKQQLIGVKTAVVSIQPLKKIIRTVGLVEYDQRNLFSVNTKVEGWIEKLYVNYTGMYIKKGEPLADVYSPDLWATQQEFINVVRWAKRSQAKGSSESTSAFGTMIAKDADALVDASRQRLRLWDISDEQIKTIEESEKPIRTLTVYSPASGYVLQKTAVQGMKVMAGEKLFDVADLSSIWISADIYEYELPLLKVGDTASIQLSYFPGRRFSSRIDYIYPALSGDTRTAKARFSIPNPGGQLKPQMFTNVEVEIDLGRKLAVPDDALIDTGLRQIAYVDKGNGT